MRVAGQLSATHERWAIAGAFVIAHGSKSVADVVVVTLDDGDRVGRGECTPYPRFGESVAQVLGDIQSMVPDLAAGIDHQALIRKLGPGAARCAIDCAMWDLAAQQQRRHVHALLELDEPRSIVTALTISLDSPANMGRAAYEQRQRALLKVKLDGSASQDHKRLVAVHDAAPDTQLIVDPNGSWSQETYRALSPQLAALGVVLLEQPLGEDDAALSSLPHPVPVAADEACRRREQIPSLPGRYDVLNIKLDKAGGLTEALAWSDDARTHGLGVMVGCHVCTSLSLAPALLVAARADFVDLDAGLLLERDRDGGAPYSGSEVGFPALWGAPRLR